MEHQHNPSLIGIGGPVEIPEALRAAALQRAMAFESRGTLRAL